MRYLSVVIQILSRPQYVTAPLVDTEISCLVTEAVPECNKLARFFRSSELGVC